jgi:ribosome-binding factor A
MSSKRDRRRRASAGHDQGPGPDDLFRPSHDARADRKVQQVCKEVERTLSYALGACGDDVVRDLVVLFVEPAPDGSRLMVTVSPSSPSQTLSASEIGERLDRVRGRLRQEIASALQRKRTPELAFRVVPPSGLGDPT